MIAACYMGHLDCVRELIIWGADIEVMDQVNGTLFQMSSFVQGVFLSDKDKTKHRSGTASSKKCRFLMWFQENKNSDLDPGKHNL
jgi:hypothetical protein